MGSPGVLIAIVTRSALTFGGKPYRESVGVCHSVGLIRCFFLNNPHIAGEGEHTTVGFDLPMLGHCLALAVLFVKLRQPRALQNSRFIFSFAMLSLRGEQKTNPIFIAAADSDTLNNNRFSLARVALSEQHDQDSVAESITANVVDPASIHMATA
ncbi:MAG: hypothetical protein VYB24_07635, partial [Pseudomonadota bacterium]|nr:hypothetical protein [Pseudomonadota bacterium]